MAVIELETPFTNALVLPIRSEPMTNGASVVSLAYPDDTLHFAQGIFHGVATESYEDKRLAGFALFEMYDGNNRAVLNNGASGAPIIDSEGKVFAVVSILMRRELLVFERVIVITPPWGRPNNSGVLTLALLKSSVPE